MEPDQRRELPHRIVMTIAVDQLGEDLDQVPKDRKAIQSPDHDRVTGTQLIDQEIERRSILDGCLMPYP
jgi:hypothetical protein